MNGKQLKNSILQWATQGNLVPQDPNDEPASILLDKIRQEKERLIKEKKIKRDKNASIIYRGDDNSYYEKILTTGEVKCIDEEIPFEIPKGWEWCRLASVSYSITDGDHMPPPKSFDGIPFIVISNMAKGVLDLNTTRYVPVEYYENLSKERVPQKNDILFSVTGSYGIAVRILTAEVFCFQRHIALIKPLLASAEYIELLLNSPLIRTQCDKTATGMAQKTVGIDSLRRFLVPIPPFQEQIKIVEKCNLLEPFIRKYSEAQEKLNRINEEIYEVLKKSILQEAIQGKLVPQISEEGTASELLEQIKVEKQKLVKDGKLKKSALATSTIFRGDDNKYYEKIGKKCLDITDEIPFEVPDSWEWVRLGSIVDFSKSQTVPSSRLKQNCWILDLEDIEKNSGKILKKKRMKDVLSKSDKHLFSKGDVLYSKLRPYLNKVVVADEDGACTTEILAFDFGQISNKYAQVYLMSPFFVDYATSDAYGIKMPRLGSKRGNNALFPIPPLKEQQRIVEKIKQLMQLLK